MLKKVQLITDGACLGNPGPGGWACVLRFGKHYKELYGCAAETTNNRMELTAAIRGLVALRQACQVEVVTDSEYVKNGITRWVSGWKRNGWLTKAKTPVLNRDLWEELDRLANLHDTTWLWTKGHADHQDNNRCDELASMAARKQINGSNGLPPDRN